jgi:hypothetical protein
MSDLSTVRLESTSRRKVRHLGVRLQLQARDVEKVSPFYSHPGSML